jgi:KDO2-lipid IV(A) lauroyltransferase
MGLLSYALQPKRVRIGINNVRAAFNGQCAEREARRIIRAAFASLGASIFELLRLPVMDCAYTERYVAIQGREHFEQAVSSGRPVVLLTGHYGNWEMTAIVAALQGYPLVALARLQNRMPRLYRLLVSYRESKGCKIVHKGGAMRQLIQALDQGRLVGIVGDQASKQGLFCDFFGRPALFATGPFHLAYIKQAVVIPAFIHRVHGPHHVIELEPPIDIRDFNDEPTAVRHGIAAFAGLLMKHIRAHPEQWLWMHKRWKYSPVRQVLILSDGKAGHVKQSQAVVAVLQERPGVAVHTVVVAFRNRFWRGCSQIAACLFPKTAVAYAVLEAALTPESARALWVRYADVAVSCGTTANTVNALWSGYTQTRSIALMNPAPIAQRVFDRVIVPRHDAVQQQRGAHLISIQGAMTLAQAEDYAQAVQALKGHARYRPHASRRGPVCAVCLGGDTPEYHLKPVLAEALIEQVLRWCDQHQGQCVVTTSRRTAHAVEELVQQRLAGDPRCSLLVVASRDNFPGAIEGMLGLADMVVVTGESISMVAEASAAGKPVVVVLYPEQVDEGCANKHMRFLGSMEAEGYITGTPVEALGAVLNRQMQQAAPKRLDNRAAVRAGLQGIL